MKRGSFAICAAVVFSVSLSSSFAQTDPWIGTWRLNVAKSMNDPGPILPGTDTFRATPGGYTLIVEFADAQGKQQRQEWPIIFDGRRHRVGTPNTDEMTSRLIDPYTMQHEFFKNGKSDGTATAVVSRDGKVYTFTAWRLFNDGVRQRNIVYVFEKQ
jgi:hypothetical protein